MKKFFSILFLLFLTLPFFSIRVHGEETTEDFKKLSLEEGWKDMDKASDVVQNTPNGGQNADKLAGKSMYGTGSVLLTVMAPELLENSEDLPEGAMRKGLLGITNDGVNAFFVNQPRIDIVAHLTEEWVPGYKESNTVYAAGHQDLQDSGISSLWSTTRNIAYAGYVVIMIIVGFMIMFRNKIGGQMVVTISNAIPKIIISLILVTFSFAIIGLIIDIAGVATNIIAAIYYGTDVGKGIQVTSPGALFGKLYIKSAAGKLGLGGIIASIIIPGMGLGTLLMSIVLAGIILVGTVRLWVVLIKAYLGVLVNVITAPLAIMLSAVPGNDAMMMNTFTSALRNALVFPLAYAIVNLPFYIAGRGISLTFPDTLTGAQGGGESTFLGNSLISVAKIIAVYTAGSAPVILKGLIPATAPKSGIDIGKSLQEGMSKVPFLGGLFK